MNKYQSISVNRAYRLLNHGPVVLVSSRSEKGEFNLAPIAWACPVGMEPCQILLAMSPGHRTFRNILQTREFIVSLPGADQAEWVRQTGSISGAKTDKFTHFGISSFFGKKIRAKIPQGTLGYLECKLLHKIKLDEVTLVVGKCVAAAAKSGAFKERLLVEKPGAKTLHHLGGRVFALPANRLA